MRKKQFLAKILKMEKLKKQLFILTTLLLSLSSAQGQTNVYHPFPDSNVAWSEFDYYQGVCEPPNYCKYTLFIQGDTTLNTLHYHKIYSNDSSSISYVGGLRENNRRIYYFDKNCSHDILLYDFNLNIGDSILLSCMYCDTTYPMYMKVVSIDSILLSDMTYRKEINFNWGPSMSWIEGIGSKFGLLYPFYTCILCICSTELVCFKQNDTIFYSKEDNVLCSDYIVSANDVKNDSVFFHIYPNPFSTRTAIHSSQFLDNACLIIYNSFGQAVRQINNISGQTIALHRDNLTSGLYFLRLIRDNKIIAADKLMIVDK